MGHHLSDLTAMRKFWIPKVDRNFKKWIMLLYNTIVNIQYSIHGSSWNFKTMEILKKKMDNITCHKLQPLREGETFLSPPDFPEVELVLQKIECPSPDHRYRYLAFLLLDIDNPLQNVSAKKNTS